MLLLGIDIGTSSVKASVIDAASGEAISTAGYPNEESPIKSLQSGWAEQKPGMWWEQVQQAVLQCHRKGNYNPADINAIGIAYQMHGLVLINKAQTVLRDSIIWCDSRAVDIGNKAFNAIGHERCLTHLLNSPGNFTASKLAWVKNNEPDTYKDVYKVLLPGDYIAMKLTGEISTSVSALSEGVFYDFRNDTLSEDVLDCFGINKNLLPEIRPVFSIHGQVSVDAAQILGLKPGIPVSYKAGDQPNNALSLNVMEPGEVAATAGTSGVIYGVTDQLVSDPQSRVNTFAHVNYASNQKRLGVLMCINGAGSLNRWCKTIAGQSLSYHEMNQLAGTVPAGSLGLRVLPFGNGAERMLNNKLVGAHFQHIDFNQHTPAHLFRAVQEGIACAFRYGLDIMRENGMSPSVIRAGHTNLFLSNVFTQSFVNVTGVPVELYNNDGSTGAALGAGIGAGIYHSATDAFAHTKPLKLVQPHGDMEYIYQEWKIILEKYLSEN